MFKKIEAIVRRSALKKILERLNDADYPGVTVYEVEGHGKQKGMVNQYRGQSQQVLLPKLKVEVVVEDKAVKKIMAALMEGAHTGEIGDGKIFVLPVADMVRIRTKEKGTKANR